MKNMLLSMRFAIKAAAGFVTLQPSENMAGGPWEAFFEGGIHKGPQRPGPALSDGHTRCSEAAGSTVPWKDTPGAGTDRISPLMLPFARATERVCSP